MAIQYKDIKALREQGRINEVWTAANIEPYVEDDYPAQTLANHSACPCHREKGYHCKIGTKSHRFTRLGGGKYCLPEESPVKCPIHNVISITNNKNHYTIDTNKNNSTTSDKNKLIQIVSNLRGAIDAKSLTNDLVKHEIRNLLILGFQYDIEKYPPLNNTDFF